MATTSKPAAMKNLTGLPSNTFRSREERNAFLATHYQALINESVLNIGDGGEGHLKKVLPSSIKYTGVDIAGNPDLKINLETELPLPFGDKSFNVVVCTDVLEHIENLHEVFAEICRIAESHIILSLPNGWASFLNNFLKGNYHSEKYYGLPFQKPLDRHKWHFSLSEAYNFIATVSEKHGFELVETLSIGYTHHKPKQQLKRIVAEMLLGKEARHNLFSASIFTLLKRKTS